MKDFVFISDFDGTLTEKDFYKMLSDKYPKEECNSLQRGHKDKVIIDAAYLAKIFNNIGRTEEEIYEDILKIALDPYTGDFIKNIEGAGGDFVILSAGTSYYIDKVLEINKIDGIKVYSNKGIFKDKGIHFVLNEKDEFYSDIYGIDKTLVVKKLKNSYKKVFYAGDSEPDLKPALLADLIFARGELTRLLKSENRDYIEFDNFSEIWRKLRLYL